MKNFLTTLFFVWCIFNQSNAQPFKFYQTNNAPKVIKPGTVSDTLLNPFAGGLNNPQFSNIDWNGDGKQDLFVFDKEALRPIAYVFNPTTGKFVHAPQFEGGFKNYFSGWAAMRDYNEDGKPDLFISSAAPNKTSVMPYTFDGGQVQLFVNKSSNAKPVFQQYSNLLLDTGMFIGPPYNQQYDPTPLPTLSGAIVAFDDLDGDGDQDILLNQGISTRFIYVENLQKNKSNMVFPKDSMVMITRDYCWGFIDYDYNKHIFRMGLDRSTGSDCVNNMWYSKKAAKHADQSTTFMDLNGDGIKDLIYGDNAYRSFIALTNGRLQAGGRYDSIVAQDTSFLSTTAARRDFIYFPAGYYVDVDADGKREFVVTTGSNMAEKTNNNIWVFDATRVNSKLEFSERSGTDFLYADMLDHGSRSVPVLVDIDKDGDHDLIVATSGNLSITGNNHDQLYLYTNIGSRAYPVYQLTDTNYANISGLSSQGFFAAHPTFGDLNGDGKLDILIGEGNGNLALLTNTSSGSNVSYELTNRNAFDILNGTMATPQLVDLDKDGLLDIVCGQTKGTIQFYKNTGTTTQPQFAATPTIDSLGKIGTRESRNVLGFSPQVEQNGFSAPHVVDLDNDGVWDLVTGSSSGQVMVYKHVYAHADSVAIRISNPFNDFSQENDSSYNKRFGNRTTVTSAWLNNDSLPDLVVGSISGGLVYLESKKEDLVNGIAEQFINNKAITLFPNPAANSFTVQFNELLTTDATLTVFDVTGRKVMEEHVARTTTQPTIQTSELVNGLYFVRLTTANWQATQRLVIQK